MKPTLLLMVAFLIAYTQVQGQIVYVNANGQGNGSSWENATDDLNTALLQAQPGTQLWVAVGIYTPSSIGDRDAAFEIPSGVGLYGGFSGHEVSLDERKPELNPTILSGEIGQVGPADNSFNVVRLINADEHTVLDGFTITNGSANGDEAEGSTHRCGGGMYIGGERSVPRIINCVFTKNQARDGAAVYLSGRKGECSPKFFNCAFLENEAGLDGGAVYNDGRQNGLSNPVFSNCTFFRNVGTYGGAVCNASDYGVCNLTMEQCTFTENVAFLRGGAIFSLNGDEKCYLEFTECSFSENYPDDQNMIFVTSRARSAAYAVEGSHP